MPCEHYKDTVMETAASGSAPSGELRAHLAECSSCRAAFAEEQTLFAAIDSGLHAAANTKVPPSLLPRVRTALDETSTLQLCWLRPAVFLSAGAVLAFAIFLIARPRQALPEDVAKQGGVAVPTAVARAGKTNPAQDVQEGAQIAAIRAPLFHPTPNSTNSSSAASSSPEVLVPPDEREGLAQLVATLNEHRDFAAAFVAQRPEKKDVLVTVDPLQIEDIEIKPLESSDTETSDGAGEEH
jgi:hypothetical protein